MFVSGGQEQAGLGRRSCMEAGVCVVEWVMEAGVCVCVWLSGLWRLVVCVCVAD